MIFSLLLSNILSFCIFFDFPARFSFCITELDEIIGLQSRTPKSSTAPVYGTQDYDLLDYRSFNLLKDELGDLVPHLDWKVHNRVVEQGYPNLTPVITVDHSCAHVNEFLNCKS